MDRSRATLLVALLLLGAILPGCQCGPLDDGRKSSEEETASIAAKERAKQADKDTSRAPVDHSMTIEFGPPVTGSIQRYRITSATGEAPPYHGFGLVQATPAILDTGKDEVSAASSQEVSTDDGGGITTQTSDYWRMQLEAGPASEGRRTIQGTVEWTMTGKLLNPSASFVNPLNYAAKGVARGTLEPDANGHGCAQLKLTAKGTITHRFKNADNTPGSWTKPFTWTFKGEPWDSDHQLSSGC
ncbi:MAG: hypothetical protein KDC46_08275 [Thermoleophilia bacterium]|nr:hypothetical protein [Thermoleophilia bacterium]